MKEGKMKVEKIIRHSSWLAIVVMAAVLGLITLAYVMMEHNRNETLSKLQYRIDHGLWKHTIDRSWHGPDLASVLVGIVFFGLLWLLPVVIVGHYARDKLHALLCLTAIGMWASVIVLVVAIGSFAVLYFTTEVVDNALSWSSPCSACIAACTLVFCGIFFFVVHKVRQQTTQT